MPEACVSIGDVPVQVRARRDDVPALLRARFPGFLTGAKPEWSLDIDGGDGLLPIPDVTVTRTNGDPSHLQVAWHDFRGSIDLARRTGRVTLAVVDGLALEALLRVTYSLVLPRTGALLLHAAGLVRDGRAYVFPGASGAGKTTLTRLAGDATVLGDELTIVTRRGTAHGTPFAGELARPGDNQGAPLRGLYFLRQGDRHAAVPLARGAALARLLARVLYFAKEPVLMAELVDVAGAIVEAVPCYELTFRRDAGFWSAIADE